MERQEVNEGRGIDKEQLAFVQFGDMEPGTAYDVQYQVPRNRIIYMTPEYKLVGVEFLKNAGKRKHRKANLSELALEGTGVSEDDLSDLLERGGIQTIRSKPRYTQSTPSQAVKDASPSTNITDPWHHLSDFRPKPGVPQVRK